MPPIVPRPSAEDLTTGFAAGQNGHMRAVVVEEFGEPGVLSVVELPVPEPSAGQVRIRVSGAGVNPVDSYNVIDPSWAGVELRCTLGYDIAGVIDAVGSAVDDAVVGRPVMAMTSFPRGQGGYAEYTVVDEALVAYLHDDVDLLAAASVPLAAGTALEVVAKVRAAGPRTLVVGGSGGVGLFFLQLAAAAGLAPVALGRWRNHEFMRSRGAVAVVDYTESDALEAAAEAAGGSFDSIVDLVGGPIARQAQAHLRDDGVVCAIATPELDVDGLIDHNQTFHGVLIRDDGARTRLLGDLLNEGKLQTHVTGRLPLDQAAEAHRMLAAGDAAGKLVLVP